MKTSTIALAALAALFSTVTADACTDGLMYCGYNLLRVGESPHTISPLSASASSSISSS